MNIIYHNQVPLCDLCSGATAETHLFCIEIEDVNSHAKQMIDDIHNTSWISELDPIAKDSYETTASRTIDKLVEIFETIDGNITENFGEYMISISAGNCLGNKLGHVVLPISELWKEQVTGNPGFDFHTESHNTKINFGEAKYNSRRNSYTAAASQINDFIKANKDKMDTIHLEHLASREAIVALLDGSRGFAIAFSLHSLDHEKILQNALTSEVVQNLCCNADELYIIGVRA